MIKSICTLLVAFFAWAGVASAQTGTQAREAKEKPTETELKARREARMKELRLRNSESSTCSRKAPHQSLLDDQRSPRERHGMKATAVFQEENEGGE